MARSACTSEDVNIQPACQLAAHACREHLIFTMNAFVILKKKKKSHMCAKCSSQRHIIWPNLSSFSSGFLREACLPCQVGSAGTQLL